MTWVEKSDKFFLANSMPGSKAISVKPIASLSFIMSIISSGVPTSPPVDLIKFSVTKRLSSGKYKHSDPNVLADNAFPTVFPSAP